MVKARKRNRWTKGCVYMDVEDSKGMEPFLHDLPRGGTLSDVFKYQNTRMNSVNFQLFLVTESHGGEYFSFHFRWPLRFRWQLYGTNYLRADRLIEVRLCDFEEQTTRNVFVPASSSPFTAF